jgi:uncharacterized lipoprotein YbaY
MDAKPLVTGEIVFAGDTPTFMGATVYVRLEDVSLMDAASNIVEEQVIQRVSGSAGQRLSFALQGQLPDDDRARLHISVHVSLSGSREIESGDYITMQSYPVLTHGYPDHVQVEVRRV